MVSAPSLREGTWGFYRFEGRVDLGMVSIAEKGLQEVLRFLAMGW